MSDLEREFFGLLEEKDDLFQRWIELKDRLTKHRASLVYQAVKAEHDRTLTRYNILAAQIQGVTFALNLMDELEKLA